MVENLPPQSEPASLHGRLRRARRRQIGALAGTAFFAWAAGALVLLWAATWGMAAGAGTWPRGAALVGIGLGAAAALAWFLARARHLDARGFARRAEEVLPEARGLVSALELEVALEDPDFPHSVALARAHVQDVSLRLTAPALERLVDRRAFVLSARTALGTAALTLLGMAIWPQD